MLSSRMPTLTRAAIAGAACVTALTLLLGLADVYLTVEPALDAKAPASSANAPSTTGEAEDSQGLLYGRVTTDGDVTYEGQLRFGDDEEAFWGHYFNGVKRENPWATYVPGAKPRRPIEIFGFDLSSLWARESHLVRPLMVRFGDIARLDARFRDLRVTMKSGTVFALDRFAADDFADGLRIWDVRRGVVHLDEWRIRSIEFLPAARQEATHDRLYGTVRTAHGALTGFIQWDREASVGSDALVGRGADGEVSVRFDSIRAIARRAPSSSVVTLGDGREIVLSGTRQAGSGHRGIYVDDRRYGRVLVSWEAFERLDFSAGGGGPAYTDFPPGRPLAGHVTTRDGRRLTGRLVYDLDESETTETLDAPFAGVNYTLPFGLVASIAPGGRAGGDAQRARVTLHTGEELTLERAGDLGDGNAGVLIFVDGQERPEYVPWADVARIDLERPPATYPLIPKTF